METPNLGVRRIFEFFGAVLIFSAISDSFLSASWHGVNIRLGHAALLLGLALWVLRWSRNTLRALISPSIVTLCGVLVFSAVYKPEPLRTVVKEVWFISSVLAPFLTLKLPDSGRKTLQKCLVWALMTVAVIILIDSYLIHTLQVQLHLGHVQESYPFGSARFLRPHAFYYEPSYAATALALAGAYHWSDSKPVYAALLWTATLLTTSRTGLTYIGVFLILESVTQISARRSFLQLQKALKVAGLCACFWLHSSFRRAVALFSNFLRATSPPLPLLYASDPTRQRRLVKETESSRCARPLSVGRKTRGGGQE